MYLTKPYALVITILGVATAILLGVKATIEEPAKVIEVQLPYCMSQETGRKVGDHKEYKTVCQFNEWRPNVRKS